jgi:hypothetical protein
LDLRGGFEVALNENELLEEIKKLEEALLDREKALPAHSIRPNQLLVIEELEETIEKKKKELEDLKKGREQT